MQMDEIAWTWMVLPGFRPIYVSVCYQPDKQRLAAFQAEQSAPDDQGRKSAETWLNELIWREFYISILYHFPEVLQHSFRAKLSGYLLAEQ